jgi:hypothetical protein
MSESELLAIDRQLRRLAEAWRGWRRALRQGAGLDDDPFETSRRVAGRRTLQQLSELHNADPLSTPLRRWVYRLAEQRINRPCLVELARQRRQVRYPLEAPQHGLFSLAEMLSRSLHEPPRRNSWLQAFLDHAHAAAELVALLWERRQEIARRMGLAHPDAIESPCPGIGEVAAGWLASSAELAEQTRSQQLAALVTRAVGSEASEGWPTQLSPSSLQELLRNSELFRGLRLDPGPLPAAVGASSFLRALARVGAAWADAAAPSHQPFAIAHDPYGLRRRTHGALFSLLPLSRTFAKRRLGLGTTRATDHGRVVSRIVVLESRAAALRVLLRGRALHGRVALGEAFEEQVASVFGVHLPRHCAGVLWQLHADDAQRFAGLLLGAARSERLQEEHDEDWFRNPRAAEQLRAEAARSPECEVEASELVAAADSLWRALADAAG